MDSIQKWRLGETLSIDETMEVLQELYKGAKKEFNFNAFAPINKILYTIYSMFESGDSAYVLYFSDTECNGATLSTTMIHDAPLHRIDSEWGELFIFNG